MDNAGARAENELRMLVQRLATGSGIAHTEVEALAALVPHAACTAAAAAVPRAPSDDAPPTAEVAQTIAIRIVLAWLLALITVKSLVIIRAIHQHAPPDPPEIPLDDALLPIEPPSAFTEMIHVRTISDSWRSAIHMRLGKNLDATTVDDLLAQFTANIRMAVDAEPNGFTPFGLLRIARSGAHYVIALDS